MDKNYGYKHTKGFIAFFVIMIIVAMLSPAFSQSSGVDVTGNLVNNTQTATPSVSTWQNAKFVNELTCWQAGDPNCSPGTPYVRPDGSINFSYGYTELYQVVNVSKALPNSGTGLVTTGFTFSWRSKNGNDWDDARQDELKAYVQGYTKSGQWIENFNYNLNFIHDWTDFSWNENWSKLRRPSDLANVIFGFAGKDNNYWMGPYGPEITNVNFQLKYKPDPCVNNPLFSPECPKFQETLQKNLTSSTTVSDTSNPPPPPEYDSQQSYSESNKPHEGRLLGEKEPGVYEEQIFVDMDRLIDTLIKIDDNQIREQKISMEASSTAIQETDKNSQQVLRQAEQVASKASKQSIEIGMAAQQQTLNEQKNKEDRSASSLSLFTAPSTSQTNLLVLPGSLQTFNAIQPPSVVTSSSSLGGEQNIKLNSSTINSGLVLNQASSTSTPSSTSIINSVFSNQPTNNSVNVASVSVLNPLSGQTADMLSPSSNFLTNKADPINSIIEQKPNLEESKQESKPLQVKTNVQDNDAAAGVSIDSIARTPAGFNSYMIALTDANFYAPKEIYRNQRTVDNARALRQLASDRLHQQMVDQQYLPR